MSKNNICERLHGITSISLNYAKSASSDRKKARASGKNATTPMVRDWYPDA